MSISILQTAFSGNGSGQASITVTVTITAGSIIHVWGYAADGTSISFADNNNGSYGANLDSFNDINEGISSQTWAQARFVGAAAGSTIITATFGAGVSTGLCALFMAEIAGAAVSPLDGHTGQATFGDGTPTNYLTSGNVTSTNQPALVLGLIGTLGGTTTGLPTGPITMTPGTGFSLVTNFADTYGCQIESKRVTATGTQAATWTASGTGATAVFNDIFVVVYDELPVGGVSIAWIV